MIHADTQQAETPSSQDGAEIAAPKMDPKLKAEWVAALRSGEYRQADSYLQKRDSFCCLGVLMKIQGVEPKEIYPKMSDRQTTKLPDHLAGGLSEEVAEDLACRNDGSVLYYGDQHSFAQIADHIEKNL